MRPWRYEDPSSSSNEKNLLPYLHFIHNHHMFYDVLFGKILRRYERMLVLIPHILKLLNRLSTAVVICSQLVTHLKCQCLCGSLVGSGFFHSFYLFFQIARI